MTPPPDVTSLIWMLFPYLVSSLLAVLAWLGVGILRDVRTLRDTIPLLEIDFRSVQADHDKRLTLLEARQYDRRHNP